MKSSLIASIIMCGVVAGAGADAWITEAAEALSRYEKEAVGANADKAKTIIEGMQAAVFAKLNKSNEKTSAQWAQAATRYNKLLETCRAIVNKGTVSLSSMDQTNLNKIKGNLESWTAELAGLGNRELAPSTEQDRWIRNVNSLNQLFSSIQNQGHADVQAVFQKFKAFVDAVNSKVTAAREASAGAAAKYADADKRVADIVAVYSDISGLSLPAPKEKLDEWIDRAVAQKQYLPKAQEALKDLAANAPNGAQYATQERYYRVDMPGKIDRMIQEATQQFEWRKERMQEAIDWVKATDARNESHVSNRLTPDRITEKLEELRSLQEEAASLSNFEARLLGKATMKALADGLAQASKDFAAKGEVAIASVRMPADLNKPELAAIAQAKIPERGFGPIRRLVINYDIHEKESTKKVIEGEWIVTYRIRWKEFQATTVEKVGSDWYLFHNDFTYYTSGDPSTTLNQWMLTGRFQSRKILEANISK